MKKSTIFFWISIAIITIWEGLMPLGTLLFKPEYATIGTRPLGYPDYFAYALILCKVVGVAAILIPAVPAKIKEWAYAGLCFNLLFAIFSHSVVDKNIGFILLPVVILIVLAVSYFYHPKRLKHV